MAQLLKKRVLEIKKKNAITSLLLISIFSSSLTFACETSRSPAIFLDRACITIDEVRQWNNRNYLLSKKLKEKTNILHLPPSHSTQRRVI